MKGTTKEGATEDRINGIGKSLCQVRWKVNLIAEIFDREVDKEASDLNCGIHRFLTEAVEALLEVEDEFDNLRSQMVKGFGENTHQDSKGGESDGKIEYQE